MFPIARVLTLRQVPSFFPIVFALIAVRLIKPIHRASASGDKKRNNIQVKVLQQLLDSRTIGDTHATLAKFRTVNLTGFFAIRRPSEPKNNHDGDDSMARSYNVLLHRL